MGSYLSRTSTTGRAVQVKTINNQDSSLHLLPVEILQHQVKTINNQYSSLHALPVEILQHISATFLPADAAASLALCSRSMLKILGGQALRSLRLEIHTIERKRFLHNLEKDLPDWLFCHHCSMFRPIDQNGDPRQRYLNFDATDCVRVNGLVSIGHGFNIRYEYAQLLMRNYRLGRPYETNLEKLSNRSTRDLTKTSLESVVTANIVAGELHLRIKYTLRLLEDWDISLIRTKIPEICPHSADSIFAQALRCRLSHANRLPCIDCKKQKHCQGCTTSFQVDIRTLEDLVTEVQVDVWRCLGSCEHPFESEWRRQANRYLPIVSREQERRNDQESMGKVFPMFGATDEQLATWCASI